MKTKLMLAALLASASMALAGPPMTPAKIKRPLHLSQITSIFPHSEPKAPAQPVSAPVQKKTSAVVPSAGGGASTVAPASTEAPTTGPVRKKVHLNTFLNHPTASAGPK